MLHVCVINQGTVSAKENKSERLKFVHAFLKKMVIFSSEEIRNTLKDRTITREKIL